MRIYARDGRIMERKRSLSAYRMLDLAIFAVMLIVFESIIVLVSTGNRFAGQAYTVSLAAAVTGIVYMRWGAWGALHALIAGVVYCLPQKASSQQLIVYMAGNLLSLAIVPVMNRLGRERIREDRYLFIPVSLGTLVLMQTGRAVISLLFGAGLDAALMFYTTDILSAVFTVVITWIAKMQNGIYEDQIHYLKRINEEDKE